MVAPISLDRVRTHLTAMAMLPEFGVRLGLQLDHVRAGAVLESQRLDVNRASPVIPVGICFAIDVVVGGSEAIRDLELFLRGSLNALDGCLVVGHDGCVWDSGDQWYGWAVCVVGMDSGK